MKIKVTIKPNSKKPGINRENPEHWIVRVRAPATEGKANQALIKAVAQELSLPASRVSLLRGAKSREKTLLIKA